MAGSHAKSGSMQVLVADDDPFSKRLLSHALTRWGYDVVEAADGREAMEILEAPGGPRLAVVDWMMPGMDGPEICAQLRAEKREWYVYVILLTSKVDTADVIAGLESGADDYVRKPFDLEELKIRVRAGARIIDLQNELVAAREAFRRQASHDTLTGIWNRGAVLECLSAEMARMGRNSGPDADLSAILLDIDRFKRINDQWGHLAGDEVIREVVSRVSGVLREYDGFGRYGGEEFLLVIPGADAEAATAVAERVCEVVRAAPIQAGDERLTVTVSAGVTPVSSGENVDEVIAAADAALYEAKASGRDRVVQAKKTLVEAA